MCPHTTTDTLYSGYATSLLNQQPIYVSSYILMYPHTTTTTLCIYLYIDICICMYICVLTRIRCIAVMQGVTEGLSDITSEWRDWSEEWCKWLGQGGGIPLERPQGWTHKHWEKHIPVAHIFVFCFFTAESVECGFYETCCVFYVFVKGVLGVCDVSRREPVKAPE
jgi:hypothetical protein